MKIIGLPNTLQATCCLKFTWGWFSGLDIQLLLIGTRTLCVSKIIPTKCNKITELTFHKKKKKFNLMFTMMKIFF